MRSLAAMLLLLLGVACQLPRSGTPLVVVIVVDQMRADYLDRFATEFSGGLRRVVEEGRIYENASYGPAITSTAPGHATLASGTHPSTNGYVGNSWYDHGIGRSVRCAEDEHARLLIGEGPAHSPRRLLRTCVGDWLQQASPRSQVVAIADKARSAVALGGQRPDWAIWREGNAYVTSSYYGDEAPAWLRRWNDEHDIALDGRHLAADESALFSMAGTVIDAMQLGADGAPDLLLLGCSVADYVGHAFGPRSAEVHDYYMQLDRELGAFFEELDTRIGKDRYRVLLSADHGVAELPEDLAAEGIDARRVSSAAFATQVDSVGAWIAARAQLQGNPFVERSFFGVVYSQELRARMDDAVRWDLVEALRGLPSVEEIYALDGSVGDDEYAPYFRNSFHPTRGCDLYFRHREHWLVGVGPTGTNHGSCYFYDRHVPVVLLGPGIRSQRIAEPVQVIQAAPTVARWLGVPAPSDLPAQGLRP